MSRILKATLLLAGVSACSDPCSMVIGCVEPRRVAVEGRVLGHDSRAITGASVRLIATYDDHADSIATTSDSRGLFSASLPSPASAVPRVSLRVSPPDRPGYLIPVNDCRPVTLRGDACVLNPLLSEPNLPFFFFHYRNDESRPLAAVQLTFRRTGGAPLFMRLSEESSIPYNDPFTIVTDSAGIATLTPLGIWAGSMDPVIGDLTVDFPAPIGRTVLTGYQISPRVDFTDRGLPLRLLGPTLAYRFEFADSATGAPLRDVELQFRRTGGVATRSDTSTIRSGSDGIARFSLVPLTYGTLVGDVSIRATPRPVSTAVTGMMLRTFDEDSTRLFAAWRVGATGILYPRGAGGR